MMLVVKCAFLYSEVKRNVCVEFPRQDARAGDRRVWGNFKEAMFATRDASQIWADTVENDMGSEGFAPSEFRPSVFRNCSGELFVMAYVHEFRAWLRTSMQGLGAFENGCHSETTCLSIRATRR